MAMFRFLAALMLYALLVASVAPYPVIAGDTNQVNTGTNNTAIKGYDTVAYFTEGQPTKGRSEFVFSWNGAQWFFAKAQHRDLFSASPERYAPQFGGYCSMALARGKIKDIDPEAWTIVDGKLYLNFSKPVLKKFRENPRENIKQADANWRRLRK